MKEKREIFLFGAGAVINWNAPTTSEITNTIRGTGFPLKNSDIKITEFIYQRLINSGYKDSEVNFETIINVIEELIVYYSEFNRKSNTPSLLKVFLSENDLSEIFNYSIKGDERKHGYQLQIPYGVDYNYSNNAYYDENPNQFFLQHLVSLLLSQISSLVADYSWNTEGHSVINKESEDSLNFRNWIRIINKDSVTRFYTLNYDNLFKSLVEEEKIECFDGFFKRNKSDYYARADVLRILTDDKSTIHYNLHGSAYWNVLPTDKNKLPNPEIVLGEGISMQMNDTTATLQMKKGKTLQVSNIITGYQKTQKSAITPFRQFQSAFDKDCCSADKITIAGYSFNDEHINESIKTALRCNEKLQIEIIDPAFINNEMDYVFALNIFPYINSNNMNPTKVAENELSYFDGKLKVFTMNFSKYIELEMKNGNNE